MSGVRDQESGIRGDRDFWFLSFQRNDVLTGPEVILVLKVAVCLLLDLAREPWPSGKFGEENESDELWHHHLPQPVSGGLRWNPPHPGGTPTAHV